jgi:hypothetical protein
VQLEEVDYRSGEMRDEVLRVIQIDPLSVPCPPAIPDLINGRLASAWLSLRLQSLQGQWLELLQLFNEGKFQEYQFRLESILISMKRVIDDLIMCAYCICEEVEILRTRKISIDGWGVLFRGGRATTLGNEIISRFVGAYDDFPDILNDLVNAFKHSYLMPESRMEWNEHFPLVRAIYAPRNDFSGVVKLHNHDMFELILGFNKFVKQVVVKMHPQSVGAVMPLNF